MFGRIFKTDDERPFQAVVPDPPAASGAADAPSVNPAADDAEWSVDEIESAYLRALEAAEAVEGLVAPEDDPAIATGAADAVVIADALSEPPSQADATPPDSTVPAADDAPRVTSRQIIEALLFVGGRPLTSRQLADVLGGSTTQLFVDDEITGLNSEYTRQQRPYEIRLGEGGYRLDLRPHFEKVRARVFGVGPREVKLPQNALEVLALVAYQQPVTRDAVEASGIQSAGNLLRQLLRRELVSLQRGAEGQPDAYRTTGRFLELFGLRSLADLPRPEAIDRR